ncbi:hypothetical protein SAMN05216257_10572 [Meinhardsimonia xiamenensis]|uniref:Uncharacterized protein n=1 Tax=Meinhardsimonia xiamenensis TaxID=990712 RepID=A0A1G9F7D9_9RHOB|nr:hypothetical protein SAMN05216257_10572 [Meinhardsimonia xiamenensis]
MRPPGGGRAHARAASRAPGGMKSSERTALYNGSSVVALISSIDRSAVTLKIFTSEISAW